MARRSRPPQHRADTPGIFIPADDLSFSRERYETELEKMRAEGLDPADHPVARYYSGKTRYDLQAQDVLFGQPCRAGDYFGPDAERWTLRRLSWDQWYEVTGLSPRAAALRACQYGIRGVEGLKIELSGAEAGRLTHADMQRIYDVDQGLPLVLGDAVIGYSMPLTDAEKKV